MYLQVDTEGYVTGYTAFGGFVGGTEVDASTLPAGFTDDFWPRKYRMEGSTVTLSGVQSPPEVEPEPDPMEILRSQLDDVILAMADMIGDASG